MEGVQAFVDRGIKQLGGSNGPQQNAMPGDQNVQGYALPARSPQEVMQADPRIMDRPADIPIPQQQAVQQQLHTPDNDMFAQLSRAADPAQQQLGQAPPQQAYPQQQQPVQQTQGGLILPAGHPPQPVPGVNNEGANPGHDSDSVSWLL